MRPSLVLLFSVVTLLLSAYDPDIREPIVTTTTERPPTQRLADFAPSEDAVIISGVPSYMWYRGCTPTALAMLLGYWDVQGYDVLPTVDYAMFFSQEVKDVITSQEHWDDYALPLDFWKIKDDKSEPPPGDEHIDNSIADCLDTSRSGFSLNYGATYTNRISRCIARYVELPLVVESGYCINPCFDVFRGEIDRGRPVLMSVKSPWGMHSLVGVGYDGQYYAANNTWDHQVQWYPFAHCVFGYTPDWCVYEIFTLKVQSAVPVEPVEPYRVYLPVMY